MCEAAEGVIQCIASETARTHERTKDLLCGPVPGRVAISQEYFGRIIQELVENACKFSPPGTPIHVISEDSPSGYQVRILDEGRGMSADQIEKIGAFMQFDRRYHEQQGLGLGLAIARRLAEIHGGTLEIRARTGGGTEVEVSLPSSQPGYRPGLEAAAVGELLAEGSRQ